MVLILGAAIVGYYSYMLIESIVYSCMQRLHDRHSLMKNRERMANLFESDDRDCEYLIKEFEQKYDHVKIGIDNGDRM